jgi:hypothetical protein
MMVDEMPEGFVPLGEVVDFPTRPAPDSEPALLSSRREAQIIPMMAPLPPSIEVLSTFRTRVTFLGVEPSIPGVIQLLSNGYARFRSDDGKVVTLVRKEALDFVAQEDLYDG